jgi:hypothetical protein
MRVAWCRYSGGAGTWLCDDCLWSPTIQWLSDPNVLSADVFVTGIVHRRPVPWSRYCAVHDFWLVEFSNGRLRANRWWGDGVVCALVLLYTSVSTVDPVTFELRANKHPHIREKLNTPTPRQFATPSRLVRQFRKLHHRPRTTHCTVPV